MLWILYSLLCALSLATADAFSKKGLERADEYTIAWSRFLFSIPYLLIALLFIKIPEIDSTFWLSIIILLPLEISATVLYIKAIKVSPLSLSIPFLSFTPLFLILTSFVILGEKPSPSGIIGIILIVIGAYTLNINSMNNSLRGLLQGKPHPLGGEPCSGGSEGESPRCEHGVKSPMRVGEQGAKQPLRGLLANPSETSKYKRASLLEPLRAIMKERGSIYMVIVAFIYSITSSLGKVAIIHSSPVFFGVIYYIILAIAFAPLALFRSQKDFKFKKNLLSYSLIGFFIALMLVFHVSAIALTDVAYMISIKRTSLLFSVIYGRLVFKEAGFRERIAGSVIMVIGVAVISILG